MHFPDAPHLTRRILYAYTGSKTGGMDVAGVFYQATPNPNSVKFTLDRPVIAAGSASYTSPEAAQASPVAAALFALEGVAAVFMLGNFVTVTKKPEAAWEDLVPSIVAVLEDHFG